MTEAPPGLANINKNALTKKEKYWLNHVNRCQQSGLSLAGYARSQGLVVKTFCAWHLRLRQRGLVEPETDTALFHRVTVKQTEPPPVTEVELATFHIRLPNGINCEVAGINPGNCTGFLESLARLRL